MKKLFSSIVAISLSVAGLNAVAANAYPDASPEAAPTPEPLEAPAPAPAVIEDNGVEVPQEIESHLALRFPGSTVYDITREGVTYVVDLGNGRHIRYDNCFNPVCYGNHDHDCTHR